MVHIEKDYALPPAKLVDNKWNRIKEDVLTNPNHKVKSACYRGTTLDELVQLYNNKCACCERSRGEELQVDHYRPKKARKIGKKEFQHAGYHWLTYEWSNLIPLCSSCNQSKSNYFPLKNEKKRITDYKHPKALNIKELQEHENPLLVNPEIDLQPERHFMYLPNGEVKGRTDVGVATVKFCALNTKTKRRERRTIVLNFVTRIESAIDWHFKEKNSAKFEGRLEAIFDDIIRNGAKDKPLSLLHIFIRNYFKVFISSHFPKEWQERLVRLFTKFNNKNK